MKYIMLMILSYMVSGISYLIRIPLAIIHLIIEGIYKVTTIICDKGIDIADNISFAAEDIASDAEKSKNYENI